MTITITVTTNQAYESSSSTTLVPNNKEKPKANLSSSMSAFFRRLCRKIISPKMKMKMKTKTKMKNNTVEVKKPSHLSSSSVHSNSDKIAPESISISSSTEQLQRVFRCYFDENGDGKVSPAELMSCVRTVGGNEHELSLEEAEWAVSTWDMDGDGLLTYHEFEKMILTVTEEEETTNSELREAFHMYEMEGSGGCITPKSLKRMLSRLGQSRSLEDCKSIIRFFDLNGDGVLCFHEFATMMSC